MLPILDEIRRVRHEMSSEIGHDPRRTVEYFAELSARYSDRLVNYGSGQKESGSGQKESRSKEHNLIELSTIHRRETQNDGGRGQLRFADSKPSPNPSLKREGDFGCGRWPCCDLYPHPHPNIPPNPRRYSIASSNSGASTPGCRPARSHSPSRTRSS